ncbi:MAG: hypothetical protein Q8P24_13220 [Desulfobacterales bacterium]|nr:hypothetical protein [Desulfobacterales bacterium]
METKNKWNLKPVWIVMSLALALVFLSSAYAYKSITNRENAVTLDVQPEQLANGQPVKFMVKMSSHSVDLAEDMLAVSELKDDTGKTYQPVNWNGSPPGGHHRSGTLEFPKLEGSPKKVTLVIRNVSEVPERIFQWDVK